MVLSLREMADDTRSKSSIRSHQPSPSNHPSTQSYSEHPPNPMSTPPSTPLPPVTNHPHEPASQTNIQDTLRALLQQQDQRLHLQEQAMNAIIEQLNQLRHHLTPHSPLPNYPQQIPISTPQSNLNFSQQFPYQSPPPIPFQTAFITTPTTLSLPYYNFTPHQPVSTSPPAKHDTSPTHSAYTPLNTTQPYNSHNLPSASSPTPHLPPITTTMTHSPVITNITRSSSITQTTIQATSPPAHQHHKTPHYSFFKNAMATTTTKQATETTQKPSAPNQQDQQLQQPSEGQSSKSTIGLKRKSGSNSSTIVKVSDRNRRLPCLQRGTARQYWHGYLKLRLPRIHQQLRTPRHRQPKAPKGGTQKQGPSLQPTFIALSSPHSPFDPSLQPTLLTPSSKRPPLKLAKPEIKEHQDIARNLKGENSDHPPVHTTPAHIQFYNACGQAFLNDGGNVTSGPPAAKCQYIRLKKQRSPEAQSPNTHDTQYQMALIEGIAFPLPDSAVVK